MTRTGARRLPTGRLPAGAGAGALALALLSGCGGGTAAAEPDLQGHSNAPSEVVRTGSPDDEADPELTETEVATGITSPWGLVELDGGDLMVSERDTGKVLRVDRGTGESSVLRTLPGVAPGGEAGLLGLAMTSEQDRVLAYYTTTEESVVVSMSWDGTTLGEPEQIFGGIPTGAGYHQGGRIVIGPDDLVYVGTGDNGIPENAQDTESLSGKVLRLTLDGEPAPGNPFDNAVYSYGHRNVEGLTFDDQGRLWAAEFGDQAWDELNLVEAGNDYGWPVVEGSGGGPDFVDPVAVWSTDDASPSGIAFWQGSLWLAALGGERLWEVPLSADGGVEQPVSHLAGEHGRLRTVTPSADGSLLLSTSNTDGRGDVRDGDDRIIALNQ